MVLAVGVTGLNDRAAGNLFTTLVAVQFNEEASLDMTGGDEMTSSGALGVEAHPVRSIAATNMIASDLNTQPLCGC